MRAEKKFWTYVAVSISLTLVALSGQLISCAQAERLPLRPNSPDVAVGPVSQPEAPWNQVSPPTTTPARLRAQAYLDRSSVLINESGIVRVEVELEAPQELGTNLHQPTDVVVVIDTSGSMEGQKLLFAQQALYELFGRLREEDRFALVGYSNRADTLVSLTSARPEAKALFYRVSAGLTAQGSTNMSAGLDLALTLIARNELAGNRATRVILLSDGLANAGDASPHGLVERARSLSLRGAALSAMGIGEDFDESIMTRLATSGTGAFYYLSQLSFLAEFFQAELDSARDSYAQLATLEFSPAQGVQLLDAMGLDQSHLGSRHHIRLGSIYAGRKRSIWLTLKVPTHRLGTLALGELGVSYQKEGSLARLPLGPLPYILCTQDRVEYERRVNRKIWEKALLRNVFTKTEEDFGDAIRTGKSESIDRALSIAQDERELAQAMGSAAVLSQLQRLEGEAEKARKAQTAPAPARNRAAKRSTARGYQSRNSAAYQDATEAMKSY